MSGPQVEWRNPCPDQYISYRESDELRSNELQHIRHRPGYDKDFISGLAISGGGIRSATFGLGVMQALARSGWMKMMDYMSTVSGGGYIGSSLTWFLHNNPAGTPESRKDGFGVSADNFPFGTGVTHQDKQDLRGKSRRQIAVLRHLLQNLNYLFPGRGVTVTSFLAVLLRGILFNSIAYIPLGLVLFVLLAAVVSVYYAVPLGAENLVKLTNASLTVAIGMIIFSLAYGFITYFFGNHDGLMYRLRRIYVVVGGFMIGVVGCLLVLASLPLAESIYMAELGSGLTTTGVLSSLWASISARGKKEQRRIPLSVLVFVASTTLMYGMLLLFYVGTEWIYSRIPAEFIGKTMNAGQLFQLILENGQWVFGPLAVSFVFGWLVNINYLSMHRYYRDRLMELFMPDAKQVSSCSAHILPLQANEKRLYEVCNYQDGVEGPYHIINGNIVLVGSHVTKFRGRGGDNFILSPLFCGSSATGWASTRKFLKGGMTLPSAMAISGAAVNPNTGAGGDGPTRNPFLSIIMGLFNLRLGFWAHNPQNVLCRVKARKKYPPQHDTGVKKTLWKAQCIAPHAVPNLFIPGMRDLFRLRLNEISRVVQLTDGGHFENLGLYELVRRRLKFIIVSDGGADKDFTFSDFANLQEKIRLDFGATIEIDLNPLIPKPNHSDHGVHRLAEQGFSVGTIKYDDDTEGLLIYLKTTLVKGLPQDLYGYRLQHKDFPDESTGDQIFDEKQFEAYRELGLQLGKRMISAVETEKHLPGINSELWEALRKHILANGDTQGKQTEGA